MSLFSRRYYVSTLASLGLLVSTALPHSALAFRCADEQEFKAANVRALQTELMVAALSCRQQSNYNSFVRKFQNDLRVHGETLKRFFVREDALNRFITKVANTISERSLKEPSNQYCQRTDALFSSLLKTPNGLNQTVSQTNLSELHGLTQCTRNYANNNRK